jgi:hypothetical protein
VSIVIGSRTPEVCDAAQSCLPKSGPRNATKLRDVLCLLPRWSEHRLLELSPVEWTKTRDRPDVLALLDANPFRRLTLDTGR